MGLREDRRNDFEERVRRVQLAEGWSLARIAREVNLPPTTMYRWMNGGLPRGGEKYDDVMASLGRLNGRIYDGENVPPRDGAMLILVCAILMGMAGTAFAFFWFQ